MKTPAYPVFKALLFVTLSVTMISGCSKTKSPYPETEKKPVTDEYFGVKVADNYQWLDNARDTAVQRWVAAQNGFSSAYFEKTTSLAPVTQELKARYDNQSATYSSLGLSKKLFALKSDPSKNQPFIVVLDSPDDLHSERVVVDPNELNPEGTTSIDWFAPSPDGKLVAVCLSENGSENGSAHVFDVATGKALADIVPRVQYPTGGGSLEWDNKGTGFYYARYPQGNERPANEMNFFQQVYYHKLGTPASGDTYVIGKEFPRIAEIRISSGGDGRYLLVRVANGDGGDFMHFLRGPDGKWVQITQLSDKVSLMTFGGKGRLYFLSRKNTPRGKILAMSLGKPTLADARTVIPESDVSISDFSSAEKHLYVVDMMGGPSRIRVLDLSGKEQGVVPTPEMSSVGDLMVLKNDELLFRNESYLNPPTWYRYNPANNVLTKTALSTHSSVDVSNDEVVREFATSKDGTRIPLNIIRRKGTELNGTNATILYGYGGYGVSQIPEFRTSRLFWLEQGGVYAIANLRGGEEFGEEWHEQGKLTQKQNVFDDFAACAKYLIDMKYASPSKLAIEGASNGGLLMGAALTQHPDLFRAVVSRVGIYDMLRVELFPNGEFNTTEFGSVKDSNQFKALYAYSPYHHVADETAYPAVLFMTGDNDGRVDPANSRKMLARLQTASSSNLPLMLTTNPHAGHGFGTRLSDRIAQEAEMYAFLADQLGVHISPFPTRTSKMGEDN